MTIYRCARAGGALLPALAVAGMLGGCGLGSVTSGIGGGLFGGGSKTETASVSEDQLLTAAKSDGPSGAGGDVGLGCPRFSTAARDAHVTIYETGRVGDGLGVVHRGEITKTSRECQIEGGRLTIKYGFAGRVLLGPRGKSGTVSLPLNVYVTDAKRERIAADKVRVDVAVELDKPIGYFSMVRTVSFPIQEGTRPNDFEVFVGFDRNVPGAG